MKRWQRGMRQQRQGVQLQYKIAMKQIKYRRILRHPNQNELKWNDKNFDTLSHLLFHHFFHKRVGQCAAQPSKWMDQHNHKHIICITHLLCDVGVTFCHFEEQQAKRRTKKALDFSHQATFMRTAENCQGKTRDARMDGSMQQ